MFPFKKKTNKRVITFGNKFIPQIRTKDGWKSVDKGGIYWDGMAWAVRYCLMNSLEEAVNFINSIETVVYEQ